MTIWAIQDSTGQVLVDLACASRLEVGRRIVPVHFDAFRLQVSSSYREVFDRAVKQVLQREGWQIVRVNQRKTVAGTKTNRQRVATAARWSDAERLSAAI
jgi:hypothetical protein